MVKYKKYFVVFLIVFLLSGVLLFFGNYFKKNQRLDLHQDKPDKEINKVPKIETSQQVNYLSPEETFEEFRLAMLVANIETALLYIKPEKRDLYRGVYGQKESVEFFKTVSDYTFLKKNENESDENRVVYYYFINNDLSMPYYLVMIKNAQGEWEIESI